MLQIKHFINNEYCDSSNKKVFNTENPATGEVLANVADAGVSEVTRAVNVAKSTFDSGIWSELEPDDRAEIMLNTANLLKKRSKEFAEWECKDSGKPISETTEIDIHYSIRALEYFANIAREIKGEVIPLKDKKNIFDYQTYEPHGVVAAITPWNFPLHLFTRAVCPALAVGNTVVSKTSPMTPITSSMMGELFKEAGMPAGVINIIHGGTAPGELLVSHEDVRMITFTGSEGVGRSIMEASSKSKIIKKMVLELGGKGAFIANDDCNISAAVNSVLIGFCLTQGQVCCASTRHYLHEGIYDLFLSLLKERCESLRIGNPMDIDTQFGALMNATQLSKIEEAINRAKADGATVITGGEKLFGDFYDKGHFFPPTILEVVDNKLDCMQSEIFGPVLTVKKINSLDEGIKLANESCYGLGASIWSNDLANLFNSAKKIDAGTVWMNANLMSTMEAPFGGNKNSGIGREYGKVGLLEYMKIKNNMLCIEQDKNDYYGFPN